MSGPSDFFATYCTTLYRIPSGNSPIPSEESRPQPLDGIGSHWSSLPAPRLLFLCKVQMRSDQRISRCSIRQQQPTAELHSWELCSWYGWRIECHQSRRRAGRRGQETARTLIIAVGEILNTTNPCNFCCFFLFIIVKTINFYNILLCNLSGLLHLLLFLQP